MRIGPFLLSLTSLGSSTPPTTPTTAVAALSLSPSSSPRRRRHEHHPTRAAFVGTTMISAFGAIFGGTTNAPWGGPAAALTSEDVAGGRDYRRPVAKTSATAAAATDVDADCQVRPTKTTIVYRPLSIDVDGIRVPVAAWHPSSSIDGNGNENDGDMVDATYEHRISVSKIGQKLAGWKLPSFFDRNFSLRPSSSSYSSPNDNLRIIMATSASSGGGGGTDLPRSAPVILLAHGYLGSRFDLSHYAEALASAGFLVLSPEYPESLAASYDPMSGSTTGIPIDRTIITNKLLETLTEEWNVRPTSYGILGHSLGCGTVDRTGDETWTRACLAGGYPSLRGPKCLFVGSVGDGAVPVGRSLDALREGGFAALDEDVARSGSSWNESELSPRSYLIFQNRDDDDNAPPPPPNHISFLSEGTNDAMVEFLSPLLPAARWLGIPLLDFDRYQISRDSGRTAEAVVPLVVDYFRRQMMATTETTRGAP